MTNHARVASIFPAAYEGTININGKSMTIIEAATLEELPPLFARYGDWGITPRGLTCFTHNYEIDADRLDETDWLRHMQEKPWVDFADFSSAFFQLQSMVELEIISVGDKVQR